MNKIWKFLGIGGAIAIAAVATSVVFGKETTEEECNEIEKQVEDVLSQEQE